MHASLTLPAPPLAAWRRLAANAAAVTLYTLLILAAWTWLPGFFAIGPAGPGQPIPASPFLALAVWLAGLFALVYYWYAPEAPQRPAEWLAFGLWTAPVAAGVLLLSLAFAAFAEPQLRVSDVLLDGDLWGRRLALCMCPGFTLVAAVNAVRLVLRGRA